MAAVTLAQPPIFIQQGDYSARLTRNILSLIATEGVVATGDFAVSERAASAAMQVGVAVGRAFVDGDDIANQHNYLVVSEEIIEVAVPTSDVTNDRIDLVVLRVLDSDAGVVGDEAQVELIEGTPDPSPSVPATPDTAIPLAQVLVQANVIAILDANITDLRVQAESFLAPPLDLNNLGDVNVPAPADGQALVYDEASGQWIASTAGATGSAGDQIFYENGTIVNTSYTLSTGFNAMSAGPIEIGSAATVTVPVGQVWTIV